MTNKQTAHETWKDLFDYVWDVTDSPEDVKTIMNLVDKYAELRIEEILEVTNG